MFVLSRNAASRGKEIDMKHRFAWTLVGGTLLVFTLGCPAKPEHSEGDGHDHGSTETHEDGDGHDHEGEEEGHSEDDGHDH